MYVYVTKRRREGIKNPNERRKGEKRREEKKKIHHREKREWIKWHYHCSNGCKLCVCVCARMCECLNEGGDICHCWEACIIHQCMRVNGRGAMDRRLHTVQDRLAEHCAQTLKTVQGSVSAVTSVREGGSGSETLRSTLMLVNTIELFCLGFLVFSKGIAKQTRKRSWIIVSTCIYTSIQRQKNEEVRGKRRAEGKTKTKTKWFEDLKKHTPSFAKTSKKNKSKFG